MRDDYSLALLSTEKDEWLYFEAENGSEYVIPARLVIALVLEPKP